MNVDKVELHKSLAATDRDTLFDPEFQRQATEQGEILVFILDSLWYRDANIKGNLFRVLTHDNCTFRQGILEPELLEDGCPLDNGRHENLHVAS
jgi:hypothetical protein